MSVVEQSEPLKTASGVIRGTVTVYMIRTRRNRDALFLPPESIEALRAGQRDQIRRVIRRMMLHRYGVVRWMGRVFRAGHRFYQKLEDRIDPLERMLKGLNGSSEFIVLHACRSRPREHFRDLLRTQFVKHSVWIVADAGLTVVAIAFSPFLVPIPGPNVILYYPALRLLSHYRAMMGARNALAATSRFEESMELEELENALAGGHTPERACEGAGVRVSGLPAFLGRL